MEATGITVRTTVSYTHLDVYKRQLLGWSPEDNREIFTLDELIRDFDYHRISKSPAVFDIVKLKWMNGEYLKAMDFDAFYEAAEPYLKKTITKNLDLRRIAEMVKTRIEIFPDIAEPVSYTHLNQNKSSHY